MNDRLDTRRIYIYLAFSFGLAWITSLIIYLTGGLQDSPMLIPEANISLALVLLAGPVMWSPTLAHVLTRLLTGEGWQNTRLRVRSKKSWPYLLIAWILPTVLTIVGAAAFFLLFPRYYDADLTMLQEMLAGTPAGAEMEGIGLWSVVILQIIQGALLSPFINGIATFGEEFGWRAYLQPKLKPLGPRRGMVLMGLIWGVWHWPVILMGHNYGLLYPGAPLLGPLAMVWFTFVVGTFLGWLTWRAQSVWPAVIGHAAVNGMANLGTIFVRGEPNPLLGPLPVGLIGGIGFTVVALLLLLFPSCWHTDVTQEVMER
ncbi:MAG: CPBP family intramembrane glutamic endopeptidase [Anaerolineales bacterium]